MTVHICHKGQQLGAFSKEQVQAMLDAGVITGETLAWTPGLAEWKSLTEILVPAPPPPLSPSITIGHGSQDLPKATPSTTDGAASTGRVPPVTARLQPTPLLSETRGPGPLTAVESAIAASPRRSIKWIVVFSTAFALLAIITLAYVGIIVLKGSANNRKSLEDEAGNIASAVTVPVQPASGKVPPANHPTKPQLKRLGDLFPSITRYGHPHQAISWNAFDSTAEYDSLFQFVDYPGSSEFVAPPSDILATVYAPGIGPIIQTESPTAPVGRDRDSVLHITDARPGACVVWVGRSNGDAASDLLCAQYAVLAACGIADQNDHKYKYLEICQGGGWRQSQLTGGSLVYFPVLFYTERPATASSAVQSVQEIKGRVLNRLDLLLNLLDAAAAEKAKDSAKNPASRR